MKGPKQVPMKMKGGKCSGTNTAEGESWDQSQHTRHDNEGIAYRSQLESEASQSPSLGLPPIDESSYRYQ